MAGTSTSLPATAIPSFRTPRGRIALVAGGVVVAAVGAIVLVAMLGGSSPAASTASSSLAAPPPPATSVAPKEDTVDVSIEVTPSHASILLDGKDVGRSPFRAAVRKDAVDHHLVVSANGYQSETRTLAFDRDVRLELELRAHPSAAVPTGAATTAPTAGSDIHVARPKHHIDETDPYR